MFLREPQLPKNNRKNNRGGWGCVQDRRPTQRHRNCTQTPGESQVKVISGARGGGGPGKGLVYVVQGGFRGAKPGEV